MNEGWICPKCGFVYSPTNPVCFNCNVSTNEVCPSVEAYNQMIEAEKEKTEAEKMKFDWEVLIYQGEQGNHEGYATCRAKVYGGWVLKSISSLKDKTESMVFIPDPEHKWEIVE